MNQEPVNLEQTPNKPKIVKQRNISGLRPFPKGVSGNPAGRPKGETLKEFARKYLALKTIEEKEAYLKKLEYKRPGFMWEMAEGKPAQDITSGGEAINPIPIYGGKSVSDNDKGA